MTKKRKKSLDEFVTARDQARFAENQDLARTARAARAEARAATDVKADLEQRLGFYEKLDRIPLVVPEWLTPKGPTKRHVGVPSIAIGDWHSGEWVEANQVGGINCYTRAIADARLRRAFEGAVTVTRDYMKGVDFAGIQVFLTGDMVSGNIHEELSSTNEGTVFENVLSIAEGLIAGLTLLAKEFGRVNVVCVVGNHGRRTVKPIFKNRAKDSFDWIAYGIVEGRLRGDSRITMQVSPAIDASVTLYGTRYLAMHGDDFHGGGGISAELAPLLLGVHRTTRQKQAEGHPFDCMVLGHTHSLKFLPGMSIIVTGSGIGATELGTGKKYTPEPPACALWVTTPERGITAFAPVFVADRVAEGW